MRESDIKFEIGRYWVCDSKKHYSVMETGNVVSTGNEQYARTEDGLAIAIARAKYLHQRYPHGRKAN